jgi:hypothetical protein
MFKSTVKWCEWCEIEPQTVFVAKKFRVGNKKFSGWVCKKCQIELEELDDYIKYKTKKPKSKKGKAFLIKWKAEKADQARKKTNEIRKRWGDKIV